MVSEPCFNPSHRFLIADLTAACRPYRTSLTNLSIPRRRLPSLYQWIDLYLWLVQPVGNISSQFLESPYNRARCPVLIPPCNSGQESQRSDRPLDFQCKALIIENPILDFGTSPAWSRPPSLRNCTLVSKVTKVRQRVGSNMSTNASFSFSFYDMADCTVCYSLLAPRNLYPERNLGVFWSQRWYFLIYGIGFLQISEFGLWSFGCYFYISVFFAQKLRTEPLYSSICLWYIYWFFATS